MLVSEGAVRSVSQAMSEFRSIDYEPTTPSHEILDPVKEIIAESKLFALFQFSSTIE